MSVKFLFGFCAQSVFLQFVQSQCTHSAVNDATPSSASTFTSFPEIGCLEILVPAIEVTPTTGGALPVTCHSALPEQPLTVASENAYEGTLSINGELPFVGTVAVMGELPTTGMGAVNHGCGSNSRMSNEFSIPGMDNSVANAVGNKRVGNDPASLAASNLNCKHGLGSRLTNLGNANSVVAGLGLNNCLGAAVGLGNARYGFTNVGKTAFSVADVGKVAYSASNNLGLRGASVGNIGYNVNGVYNTANNAWYGGSGEGTIAVVGDLPVAGTTVVAGQLPIVGAVRFSGNAPAFGTVTVAGSCSCDCGRYLY